MCFGENEFVILKQSLSDFSTFLSLILFLSYGKSPYIYPLYGLGGLPEGFSRLCAINGGEKWNR